MRGKKNKKQNNNQKKKKEIKKSLEEPGGAIDENQALQTKMAGDAPNSKRDGGARSSQLQVQMGNDLDVAVEVGVDAALAESNLISGGDVVVVGGGGGGGGSNSEPSSSSDTDSDCNEGNAYYAGSCLELHDIPWKVSASN